MIEIIEVSSLFCDVNIIAFGMRRYREFYTIKPAPADDKKATEQEFGLTDCGMWFYASID